MILPIKFNMRDFNLIKTSLIGEEPHEIRNRLVGVFKRQSTLARVCEDLRDGLHRGFSNRPWFVSIHSTNNIDYDISKSSKAPHFHTYVEYSFASNFKVILVHYKWSLALTTKHTAKAIEKFEFKMTQHSSCIAHSVRNNYAALAEIKDIK